MPAGRRCGDCVFRCCPGVVRALPLRAVRVCAGVRRILVRHWPSTHRQPRGAVPERVVEPGVGLVWMRRAARQEQSRVALPPHGESPLILQRPRDGPGRLHLVPHHAPGRVTGVVLVPSIPSDLHATGLAHAVLRLTGGRFCQYLRQQSVTGGGVSGADHVGGGAVRSWQGNPPGHHPRPPHVLPRRLRGGGPVHGVWAVWLVRAVLVLHRQP
mmetsp:Transcript_42400/g.68148  ORF Transcript_42400/g.68148 Transcript_42400/m.68148 type:complete len:213 (-) Transcript_42400:388-1026(-)